MRYPLTMIKVGDELTRSKGITCSSFSIQLVSFPKRGLHTVLSPLPDPEIRHISTFYGLD